MARIRSLKPEFWADEELTTVPRDARLLYIGLWNLSDEHSRLRGDPRYVKGQLFPYDDDLTAADIDGLLQALESISKVVRYRAGSAQYLFLPNLGKHQRLEAEKVPSKLPPPPDPNPDPDGSVQVSASAHNDSDSRADLSAPRTDESAPDAEDHALLYVAGSMEHVAGSMKPPARKPRAAPEPDPNFDRFWAAYPRRVEKLDARKAWADAAKKASPDILIAAAARYAEQERDTEAKFIAHPATWLNKERWTDEPAPRKPPRGSGNGGFSPHRNHDDPHAFDGYRPHHRESTDDVA